MSQFKDVWELLKGASEPGAVLEVRNSEQKSAWITSSLLCLPVKDIVERVARLGIDHYRIRPKTRKQKCYIIVFDAQSSNSTIPVSNGYHTLEKAKDRLLECGPKAQIIEIEIDVTE